MPPDDNIFGSAKTMTSAQLAFLLKARIPALRQVPNDVLIQKILLRRPDLKSRIVEAPSEAEQAKEVIPRTMQQAQQTLRDIPQGPPTPEQRKATQAAEEKRFAALTPAQRDAEFREFWARKTKEDPVSTGQTSPLGEALLGSWAVPSGGPRPPGLFRNFFWEEPKGFVQGQLQPPGGLPGTPPFDAGPIVRATEEAKKGEPLEAMREGLGIVPLVGPILSERLKQAETDFWGATGATLSDVAMLGIAHQVAKQVGAPEVEEKVTLDQGAKLLADEISSEEMSPAQAARRLRSGFDDISSEAGAKKGAVIARVINEAPKTQVRFLNVIQTLREAVDNLQTMKKMNPGLFKEGEAYATTLDLLEKELQSVQQEAHAARVAKSPFGREIGLPEPGTNIETADLRRQQWWKYRETIKPPSYARKLVADLNQALTKDIRGAIAETNPALADEYVTRSNRYHQIQDIARDDTFKRIFGQKRMSADKVVKLMYENPEESLQAIRALWRENPQALQLLRRQLFEYGIQRSPGKLPRMANLQPSVLREMFGPQTDAVQKFIEASNPIAQPANALLRVIKDKFGATKYLLNDTTGNKMPIEISGAEMAKIIDSAQGLTMAEKALRMRTTAPPADFYRKMLIRLLPAFGISGAAAREQAGEEQ